MITLVKRTNEERRELFRNTADKMGLQDAIIEKDFWVCYTLDYLFHRSPWKKALAFKGGTSLSKAFGLIQRFSEDIDLILDWRILGFELHEPWNLRTKNKQDVFNKEANARAANFLQKDFCPQIPISSLPLVLRPVSYCLPLTYGTDILRSTIAGTNTLPPLLSFGVLLLFSVALFFICRYNINRKWIL